MTTNKNTQGMTPKSRIKEIETDEMKLKRIIEDKFKDSLSNLIRQ